MPQLEYFLVAESSSIDVQRNSVSIFHVLNDVRVDELPTVIPSAAVVSCWIFDDGMDRTGDEYHIRVEFDVPGEENPRNFRGTIVAGARFQVFGYTIIGVPIYQAGDVVVRLFLNEEQKAAHTIAVSVSE